MATEVKHGAAAAFRTALTGGEFSVQVVGNYTVMRQRGAGGVPWYQFASNRPAKRLNELLVLRTCFLEWYLQQWIKHGGTRRRGIKEVRGYPFKRKYGPRGGLRWTRHSAARGEVGRRKEAR